MAFPTLAFNSTGSDTAASGAGPATALFGTAAATAANTTVTLLTDNPDLSGVATDGSAVIWVGSSSGRQFAKITGKDNTAGVKTITVSDAYANTESGKNWGIGGKRATLAGSLQLGTDIRAGWTIDIQTDQTLTANFNIKPNAVVGSPTTITSTVGTMATKIQTSTNSIHGLDVQNANNLIISNLYLKTTAGTPGEGITCAGANACTNLVVTKCILDGWLFGIRMGDSGTNARMQSLLIQGCEIKNCTQNALWNSISGPPTLVDCYIHGNGTAGSGSTYYAALGQGNQTGFFGSGVTGGIFCKRCIFAANKGPAVNVSLQQPSASNGTVSQISFEHCNFYKNNAEAGSTVNVLGEIDISVIGSPPFNFDNCIFYGLASTNFAIKVTASSVTIFSANNCAFGTYTVNTSGTGVSTGTNPVTLTADPFTSSTDFSLNATAGGGASCKGGGAQLIPNATASTDTPDIGAIQSLTASSTDPGIANVRSGTGYTYAGSSLTGTLAVPAASTVQAGISVDAGTGTLATKKTGIRTHGRM